jgi:succinyl-CoA synthetase beta subunit
MKIHEYQGKETPEEIRGATAARHSLLFRRRGGQGGRGTLGGKVWVVKAQIHAGGRGKGGGVKVAKNLDEVSHLRQRQILGMQLKTHQTGPEGQKVRRLLVEEGADIKKEYYVAAWWWTAPRRRSAMMASSEGGMDIEEVARIPRKRSTRCSSIRGWPYRCRGRRLSRKGIGVPDGSVAQARSVLQGSIQGFWETDASLAEINPLILTGDGGIGRWTPR